MLVHSSLHTVRLLTGGSTVIIHGVGGVGLWAVSVARAVLPSTTKILVMDVAVS